MTSTQIAQVLDQAAREAKPVAQMSEKEGFSLREAYIIQLTSIQRRIERGEKITGFKLGFTSKAKMEQMGVHDLIWGVLTDAMQIEDEGEISLSNYIHPRAEPEVAFLVSKPIDKAISQEQIPNYISKMAVAIEVIDSRYENFKFSLEDVVADNCSSIGYCIGEWKDAKPIINNLPIELSFNKKTVQQGSTKAILENPYQSVVELSRLATEAGLKIDEGYVILAGAATAAEWMQKDTKIEAHLQDVGEVSFNVK
ncbi:2-keto-4-pentenoate hydratase [Psychroflexus salis]|uniref:2-hydroxypenta-2,4-dienoate hydratase n=1 Tax=Psychroflexus salis TaxID=1526574 RepID=A0A917E9E6_9FLAO|nr:fumarylacetoacetate hydrolase family protein [Psychroflexus salis]GGE17111.1 2-hydroxypenta-2,4-dienoate hydratase [Psychroflexus salis]